MKGNNKSCCNHFQWFQLFISILLPIAITVYTIMENNRDLMIAKMNREQDLELMNNEQKDMILQECLKSISKLIEKYGLELNKSSSISLVVRFKVLSTIDQLDYQRRNFLIQSLYEAKLITYRKNNSQPIVLLSSANLTNLRLIDKLNRKLLFHLALEDVILIYANFSQMNIHGGNFEKSILTYADFSSTRNALSFDHYDELGCTTNFTTLSFRNTDLEFASFYSATYDNADFYSSNMMHTNLNYFFCENCNFDSAIMTHIHFENGELKDSLLLFTTLNYANFYKTIFNENIDFYQTEMIYANITYAKFRKCYLNQVILLHTIFDYSIFVNTNFTHTQMINVSIQFTKIYNGNFTNTDLSQSNWKSTYCEKCLFDQTNFTGANFDGTIFNQSLFRNCIIRNEQLKQIASFQDSIIINDE